MNSSNKFAVPRIQLQLQQRQEQKQTTLQLLQALQVSETNPLVVLGENILESLFKVWDGRATSAYTENVHAVLASIMGLLGSQQFLNSYLAFKDVSRSRTVLNNTLRSECIAFAEARESIDDIFYQMAYDRKIERLTHMYAILCALGCPEETYLTGDYSVVTLIEEIMRMQYIQNWMVDRKNNYMSPQKRDQIKYLWMMANESILNIINNLALSNHQKQEIRNVYEDMNYRFVQYGQVFDTILLHYSRYVRGDSYTLHDIKAWIHIDDGANIPEGISQGAAEKLIEILINMYGKDCLLEELMHKGILHTLRYEMITEKYYEGVLKIARIATTSNEDDDKTRREKESIVQTLLEYYSIVYGKSAQRTNDMSDHVTDFQLSGRAKSKDLDRYADIRNGMYTEPIAVLEGIIHELRDSTGLEESRYLCVIHTVLPALYESISMPDRRESIITESNCIAEAYTYGSLRRAEKEKKRKRELHKSFLDACSRIDKLMRDTGVFVILQVMQVRTYKSGKNILERLKNLSKREFMNSLKVFRDSIEKKTVTESMVQGLKQLTQHVGLLLINTLTLPMKSPHVGAMKLTRDAMQEYKIVEKSTREVLERCLLGIDTKDEKMWIMIDRISPQIKLVVDENDNMRYNPFPDDDIYMKYKPVTDIKRRSSGYGENMGPESINSILILGFVQAAIIKNTDVMRIIKGCAVAEGSNSNDIGRWLMDQTGLSGRYIPGFLGNIWSKVFPIIQNDDNDRSIFVQRFFVLCTHLDICLRRLLTIDEHLLGDEGVVIMLDEILEHYFQEEDEKMRFTEGFCRSLHEYIVQKTARNSVQMHKRLLDILQRRTY